MALGMYVFFFTFKDASYLLRSSGVHLSLPKYNLKWMKNSYTYRVVNTWNSLKTDLRQESRQTFKRKVNDIKF